MVGQTAAEGHGGAEAAAHAADAGAAGATGAAGAAGAQRCGPPAGSPASSVPVPYEVRRAWPEHWDLLRCLRGEAAAPEPGPARYLHPSLEVRPLPGRGRGVVAADRIEAGELLLLDTPLAAAASYGALLAAVTSQAAGDPDFRRQLLSICGDAGDEAACAGAEEVLPEAVVRNILRHNYHGLDASPADGALPEGPPALFGLWPLGSLVNHSLRPNVTRSFAGEASCYRLIRPLEPEQEALDNYLDLRLPRAVRRELLRRNHGFDDEGPDDSDAPAGLIAKVQDEHSAAMQLLQRGTQEGAQAAWAKLAAATNRCAEAQDPVFTDIFRDFGLVSCQLGDAAMALNGLAQAVELATAREPYSVISCMLALRMLHLACVARDEVDGETRDQLEALAREHYRMVYGPWPGVFEAMNPQVTRELAEAARPGREAEGGAGAGGVPGKRTRLD